MAYTLQDENQQLYTVSLGGGTLTLSQVGAISFTFDGEGRPYGAWLNGVTYRRTLDNRILAKRPGRGKDNRQRRYLPAAERVDFFRRVWAETTAIATTLFAPTTARPADFPAAAVEDWLARVAKWDVNRLEGEQERFYEVYKPVPIMPPDQYLALVVQATEGCSYNQCTFCTFYRHRPFRVKNLSQFRDHVQRVKAFLGRGLAMRHTIFMADANALITRQALLVEMLRYLSQQFVMIPQDLTGAGRRTFKAEHPIWFDGVYAFATANDVLRKSEAELRKLATLGLRRVYIGLESGHDLLLRWLRKPNDAAAVIDAVKRLHAGQVHAGVVLMIGVGGERFGAAHVQDSVKALAAMQLGRRDIVYFSPFFPDQNSEYVRLAAEENVLPLNIRAMQGQENAIRARLRAAGVVATLSRYDIREFVY